MHVFTVSTYFRCSSKLMMRGIFKNAAEYVQVWAYTGVVPRNPTLTQRDPRSGRWRGEKFNHVLASSVASKPATCPFHAANRSPRDAQLVGPYARPTPPSPAATVDAVPSMRASTNPRAMALTTQPSTSLSGHCGGGGGGGG